MTTESNLNGEQIHEVDCHCEQCKDARDRSVASYVHYMRQKEDRDRVMQWVQQAMGRVRR